eukprot:jgi/Mesvir1/21012/Mv08067-RA.1
MTTNASTHASIGLATALHRRWLLSHHRREQRKHEPQPDWWFVGGRMRPGETPEVSAARVLRRELGMELADLSRLRPVTHLSMVWAKRVQPPADNGTCDISCVLTIAVTEEEASGIRLTPDEYCDSQWVDPRAVVDDHSYHPALRHAVRALLTAWEWDKLIQRMQAGASDDAIGADCRRVLSTLING